MQIRLKTLLLVMLISGLLVAASRRFLGLALRVEADIAGVLVLTVSIVVGSLLSTQTAPRVAVLLGSLAFSIGLANGWIEDFGDDMTMWAFFWLSIGLLIGAVARPAVLGESSEPT